MQDWIEQSIRFEATDGYSLGGFVWRSGEVKNRPFVLITCATSVRCRYYARFAQYLFEHGYDVLTYDYRGIGESRPPSLKDCSADWADWGEKDLEGALRYIRQLSPDARIHAVAHSIGGFALGLAQSNHLVQRVLMVGAQFAHYRDYADEQKWAMLWRWHVVMPLLTRLCGYFPAKKLGWMEDTPAGVALDWSRMGPAFERSIRRKPRSRTEAAAADLKQNMLGLSAPILAIATTDDPFATVSATERLLSYYENADRHFLRLKPETIDEKTIGHFAFFHDRYREKLWPLAVEWLKQGEILTSVSGDLHQIFPSQPAR
ncbi:alpha/beta fold hydrolase [Rhizobium sp. FKY42]|uniref:alpha/beta hydrolase family protein n=1 Tax=Rhizobium sp. FKY42 TaxID=2562310 RepID=UPI0010C06C96|nr:alpha/beta fold hydrolase [Rhizobium sp. FKY42]